MSMIKKSNIRHCSLTVVLILFLAFLHTAFAHINGSLFFQRSSPVVYGVLPADKKLFIYKVHQAKGEVFKSIKFIDS